MLSHDGKQLLFFPRSNKTPIKCMNGKKYMQKKINSCKSGQKYILDIFYTDYVYFYINKKQQGYRHGQWIPGELCPPEPLRIQHYFRYSTIVDSIIVFHKLLRSDLSLQGFSLHTLMMLAVEILSVTNPNQAPNISCLVETESLSRHRRLFQRTLKYRFIL